MPQEKKRRKKRPAWKHYKKTGKEDDAHPSVECNYCSKVYQRANPKRMQKHLDKKCQKAPNNAKSQFRQQMNEKNEEEQKSLVSSLARALCSAKVQPSFIDNESVIQFFQLLNPSFKLPNSEELKAQMNEVEDQLNYSSYLVENPQHYTDALYQLLINNNSIPNIGLTFDTFDVNF